MTLSFTGERFLTECQGEMVYEHWHRYLFAREYAKGKRVLDIPSGIRNSLYGGVESSAIGSTEIALTAAPRIGLYTNVKFGGRFLEEGFTGLTVSVLPEVATAAASASLNPASDLTDGKRGSDWFANSGGRRWVEMHLGSVRTNRKISLFTEQTGMVYQTVRGVCVGTSSALTNVAMSFSEVTRTHQWLDRTFINFPPTGRYVGIITLSSNSWRAWREVEICQ